MRIVALFVVFMSVMSASAQELSEYGVDTTQTVPSGLAVGAFTPSVEHQTWAGASVTTPKAGQRQLLFFYKGAWNTKAKRFLSNLKDSLDREKIELIVLTPELEGSTKRSEKVLAGVTVCTVSKETMELYEVAFALRPQFANSLKIFQFYNTEKRNEGAGDVLPANAMYLVSKSGKLLWRYFSFDHRHFPSVEEINGVK
ncbi:MAG: hypothetical protein P8N19_12065 [Flavobacteriales bacterium]|nr:hypothetical protein [Flavobacteriales bacterium]MDG1766541.1 hypothetical protein [Flavobacteriales bacterium]